MTTKETDLLEQRLDQVDIKLGEILEQTKRTNGRVDKLESWRDKMTGVWIAISLVSPLAAGLLVSWLTNR